MAGKKAGIRFDNDEKFILNRQINYNIIKTVWMFYNPKKNRDGITLEIIYDNTIGNRSGFDKVVAGTSYSGSIEENVVKRFGLPLDIMLGNEILEVPGISKEDLVSAYSDSVSSKQISRDDIEGQIIEKAREVNSKLEANGIDPKNNFHKLCYFCKYTKPLPEKDVRLIGLQEALLSVTPNDWENCDNQALMNSVKELLRLHIQCADTMSNYKRWSGTQKISENMKNPLYSTKKSN